MLLQKGLLTPEEAERVSRRDEDSGGSGIENAPLQASARSVLTPKAQLETPVVTS